MASRMWTCACGSCQPRIKQKCPECGGARPKRKTASQKALSEPYEVWVERFGERCNICGRERSENRRLDRDHDHKTGEARGLLCHRCNRGLPNWATAEWLRKATAYLERGKM